MGDEWGQSDVMFACGRVDDRIAVRLGWALAFACVGVAGCTGGLHHRGEKRISVLGSYGHAVKGETVWHDADGRADNAGMAVGIDYYTADRFSVGAALTPYRNYNQGESDACASEFQLALRYHLTEFEIFRAPGSAFVEILGGLMQSDPSVPERGSHTNFTQDTGVGLEVRLAENVSWVTGYRFRHLSNGYVFSDDNPSQNDNQVYMGLALSW